ncbi:MAG: hypothetical protein R3Y68_03140 [Rikenellaceae bacterium]
MLNNAQKFSIRALKSMHNLYFVHWFTSCQSFALISYIMANLKLSFTSKNGAFVLCATTKGTSLRHYKTVMGLRNPNFDCWDRKTQRFTESTSDALYNNGVLLKMRKLYQGIIDVNEYISGKDLFASSEEVATPVAPSTTTIKPHKITMGEFLIQIISEMKFESVRRPSKNYQHYITLLHKLEDEKRLIKMPIESIDDTQFMKFCKYVAKELKGVNYMGLTKHFKATIGKAKKRHLTKHVLDYPYAEDMPAKKINVNKIYHGVDVLTAEEYQRFIDLDMDTVPSGGVKQSFYKWLYRDFCVFLYEMKMRPCDVLALQKVNLIEGTDRLAYIPMKKKNFKDERRSMTINTVTPIASELIKKYAGQSSQGYIFPFAMNEYSWDLNDAVSFNKWYNRKQYTLEKMNRFLFKIKTILKVNKLTLYTFRHSTFTHEIGANNKPLLQIAKEGGTGVEMLEKHYYNHFNM